MFLHWILGFIEKLNFDFSRKIHEFIKKVVLLTQPFWPYSIIRKNLLQK